MHSTAPEIAVPLGAQEAQGPLKMICGIGVRQDSGFRPHGIVPWWDFGVNEFCADKSVVLWSSSVLGRFMQCRGETHAVRLL